jgi:hypothetical protein
MYIHLQHQDLLNIDFKIETALSILTPFTSRTFRAFLWPLSSSTSDSEMLKTLANSAISWRLAFPFVASSVNRASSDRRQGLKPEGTASREDPGTTSKRMMQPRGWGSTAGHWSIISK